MVVIRVGD